MGYKILIFGGTTEGLRAARLLDAIGEPYLYSTKTKTKQQVLGQVITGAMTLESLKELIPLHNIKLIIDAAHPFAENLHQMLSASAEKLGVTTVRYHRIFPNLDNECIQTFSSYEEMQQALIAENYQNILALTGVQTIIKLNKLWPERNILFRILDSDKSLALAKKTNIPSRHIWQEAPSDSVENIVALAQKNESQVILSKESGTSGFFSSKVDAAKQLGIPLWVVKRPHFDNYTHEVKSSQGLHQLILRLRKTVLKHEELRSGYTTGSCLTAAAQAAFTAIMMGEERSHELVQIACGEQVPFLVYEKERTENTATYVAIKDGGDDPDVTHAHEIGCTLSLSPMGITFHQGIGVGRVTLPGLQIGVGEAAINPVPRQVISLMIENLSAQYDYTGGVELTAFVPDGGEIAKRTFNPRVGVVGGISIIGTTGKVMPYSAEAFVGAIEKQLAVAHNMQCNTLLATSGLRSEEKIVPHLPTKDYTAVHFGNFVGETLQLCHQYKFEYVVVGVMLGKAIKLAEGRLDTHSKLATFNKAFVLSILKETSYPPELLHKAEKIQLANELSAIIPFSGQEPFYQRIAQLCYKYCKAELPKSAVLTLHLLSANHNDLVSVCGI